MTTIIEKIRAEVERRKNNAETLRERNICIDILSRLSDLEKECEKPNIQWSEEDENRLNAVIELLENTSAIHPNYSHRKLIIWLKSFHLKVKSEKPINHVLQDFPTTEKEMQDFLATHERIPVPERLNSLERILQEKPVCEDLEEEFKKYWDEMPPNTILDKEAFANTARHFYELGRQSKEQPACEVEEEEYEQIKQKVCSDCPSHKDDDCGYVTRKLQRKCNYLSDVMYGYELGRQSKQTEWTEKDEKMFRDAWWHISYSVSNGTSTDDDNGITRWLKDIRNRIQQSKPEPSKDLKKRASEIYPNKEGGVCSLHSTLQRGGYIRGYQDCKEQMMKEAVEGEVVQDIQGVNRVKSFSKVPDWLHFGQKVRIIIVKED